MTRAAAARAAAELEDTAPGSILEGNSEDEDMVEGPLSEPDAPTNLVLSQCLTLALSMQQLGLFGSSSLPMKAAQAAGQVFTRSHKGNNLNPGVFFPRVTLEQP